MSTRHKTTSGPLSQNRYMSSEEFAELRGVNGVAVSARAAVLLHASKRNFIWWLQGLSLNEGGLPFVAHELLEMFPERIGTAAMHKAKVEPGKMYSEDLAPDFDYLRYLDDEPPNVSGVELKQRCRRQALANRIGDNISSPTPFREFSIEQFMVELCINPKITFSLTGGDAVASQLETDLAIESTPKLSRYDFQAAELVYFQDIVGALFEYKVRCEKSIRENFQLTAIGKKIWQTLDYALASRGMVVLDGLEGRGKTEAVKAWCAMNLGSSRFVSLKGITNKTTAFREIAKALGIASSYTRTAPEMQARIEDVLKRSKLLLVIDEAHFVFNQSRRMYTRPELVDWIDTAICNQGIGIALVTTPQFMVCMTRAADQVEWNYRQFRRRVKRWEKLPAVNTKQDIIAVAKSVFKSADAQMVDLIAGYALVSKRDLSAIGDIASEVRVMLGTDDLSKATARHIHRAIHEYLLPSDKTFLEDMAAARSLVKKPGRRPAPTVAVPEPIDPPDEAPADREQPVARPATPPARGIVPVTVAGSRRHAGSEAELTPA